MRGIRYQHGIGLIEVMVTLVVISIGILALVNFQSFAFRSAAVASNHAAAISIAQDEMAQLRTFIYIKDQPNQTDLAFENISSTDAGDWKSKPVGNTDYKFRLDVENYCYTATNAAPKKCDNITGFSGVPDLKRLA